MTSVVFIRKMRNTRSDWAYLSDHGKGTMTAPDGDLTVQMGTVIEFLVRSTGEDITVISPQMNAQTRDNMLVLFPKAHFMPITESSVNTFFDRAFEQTAPRRRVNQNILYIGSDASGGHLSPDGVTNIPAAWAWCSDGVNGGYDFGDSGLVNVNVSEFEGIMNAVVANADSTARRIHIFSDSANAVDMFNYDLVEGIVPREARKYGLVSMAKATMEVVNSRAVTVEWVKGHRAHRLNNIADSISRHARKRFTAGHVAEDFVRETDALYAVFNRNV
jgi:ribonuclease HI